MKTLAWLLPCALALHAAAARADVEKFSIIINDKDVGRVVADTSGDRVAIEYDLKDNGRGPTIAETLTLDPAGLPTSWTIRGTTTFGSKVDESFKLAGKQASWVDSTGKGSAVLSEPSLYVGQNASPWALGLYVRALLRDADARLPALPGGALSVTKGELVTLQGAPGSAPLRATSYALRGLELQPADVLLDEQGKLVSYVTPSFIVIRAGYDAEQKRLRELAAKWSTDRYIAMQKAVAHRYRAPVRIRNVRIFDSSSATLSAPLSVVIHGRQISAIEPLASPATPGEVGVDGAGGTLVPGMFDMHSHLSHDEALLDIAAGVTSVRDMGNYNAVLDELLARIEDGTIAGPRVTRSGFIEGQTPFSANVGIVVDSEAKALDAVRWYAARGYWQIKVYNSMNPAWVPALAKEAHALGLRVAGHVPAFSNADAMIAAGYDELTHINQFMLGWVLQPEEDTRTLLRFTALRRLPALDLNGERAQRSVAAMVERKLAIDPTLVTFESMLLTRDAQLPPGMVDYLDHMPINYQRNAKQSVLDTSQPADDKAYRDAFDKILATVKLLNERGVFIVPGTDSGGSFSYHRELELYQRAGMTPAQILKRASFDMARYLGQEQRLGSIEKGKLADFFLVPGDPTKNFKAIKNISMVVKNGTLYFPSEIYPQFGIKPFAKAPKLSLPARSELSVSSR